MWPRSERHSSLLLFERFNFNLVIKQKDWSATYIDMHEMYVETL